jgi:uncharacterized repeat protein (TIGR01451 family)
MKSCNLARFRPTILSSAIIFAFLLVLAQTAIAAPVGDAVADIGITKSGEELAPRNSNITYTIVVSNGGPDTASNVTITDPIPANTVFVSANVIQGSGSVSFDGTQVTATFASIDLFESGAISVVVKVNTDVQRGTVITNTATVTSASTDPESSNDTSTAQTTVIGPFAGDLVISEFRTRGPGSIIVKRPNGQDDPSSLDEYVEVYNNSGTDIFVNTAGQGYAIVASDGQTRCTIPNGTVLPNKSHFLCANSLGYSLSGYPAGNNTGATPDATFTTDIPDNVGIAIFISDDGEYSLDDRLDAVGSANETNPLYKEGTGYPAVNITPGPDSAFYRDNCGRQGVVTDVRPCTITTGVIDTDDNAHDFIYVSTDGSNAGAGGRLGAPGPENRTSPIERNAQYNVSFLDPCVGANSAPNFVRDTTSDPSQNSTLGTIDIRRTITNNGSGPATRLRFRVTQQTTRPVPLGTADIRLRSSSDTEVTVDRAPCGSGTSDITVYGTTLEQPPFQTLGGGYNSTVSAISPLIENRPKGSKTISGALELGTPLNPGESIDLRFLYGVQQQGKYRLTLNIEVVEDTGAETTPNGSIIKRQKMTALNQTNLTNSHSSISPPAQPSATPFHRSVYVNLPPVLHTQPVKKNLKKKRTSRKKPSGTFINGTKDN